MPTRRSLLALASLVLALGAVPVAADDGVKRIRVTADQAHLMALPDRPVTVAVANPGIVDVHLVSPTQMLLNGKSVGATSLTIFYGRRSESFELVVQPKPFASPHPLLALEPHAVLVHRGARLSTQQFVRDGGQTWLELGPGPSDTDPTRK